MLVARSIVITKIGIYNLCEPQFIVSAKGQTRFHISHFVSAKGQTRLSSKDFPLNLSLWLHFEDNWSLLWQYQYLYVGVNNANGGAFAII